MFKKMNYRILVVVLLVLAALLIITRYINRNERTFKDELVSFAPDDITEILFTPDAMKNEQVHLQKETEGLWKVYSGEKAYNADTTTIYNMLRSIAGLRPSRVAAMNESKWKEFQVDDSAGIRIKLFQKSEEVADVVIGKFSYKPAQGQEGMYGRGQGTMTSYVRLYDEKEVYAVDGYLRMGLQSNINGLRDKALSRTKRDDITRVTFTYPGTLPYTLERQGSGFSIDGIPADSATSALYLNSIARLSSQDFFADVSLSQPAAYNVKIEGNNMLPVEIMAYPVTDTLTRFILTSSINPGTLFSGYGKNKLFEKIFVPMDKFAVRDKTATEAR